MNKIYVTGDKHGSNIFPQMYDIEYRLDVKVDETDYLIILGDFGLIWGNKKTEDEKKLVQLLSEFPNKVLFVDGNHENHYRLNLLERQNMFSGIVGKYNDQIYHLRRGEIYDIYGYKLFCMGGAKSVDRMYRIKDVSWWENEIPTYEEMEHGISKLNEYREVDYILGHTCPYIILKEYMDSIKNPFIEDCPVSKFFDYITHQEFGLKFKKMYFGHLHDNWTSKNKKYTLLYDRIIELGS